MRAVWSSEDLEAIITCVSPGFASVIGIAHVASLEKGIVTTILIAVVWKKERGALSVW